LIEWIVERTTKYLKWETHPVTLTPFKLTDDEGLRQVLLQLYGQGKASVSTLLESYGINYEDELKKIREDTLQEAISQAQMGMEVDRGVFLATKKAEDKFDTNNDYRTALAKAQQLAEELHTMDPASCRQILNSLKIDDYATYLMASKLLEEIPSQMSVQVGPDGQPLQPDGSNPIPTSSEEPSTGPKSSPEVQSSNDKSETKPRPPTQPKSN
jgi:hypothetical protein